MKKSILFLLVVCAFFYGINKASASSKELKGAQGIVACKAEIKNRLSSAKLPGAVLNYTVNGNIVKVNDSFQAQNDYGVYRKYNYSCTVQITGENETQYNYKLKNLSIW